MKPHTKLYLSAMGYDISDFIPCEIPNCGQRGVDINHIDARGMGGSKTKDFIENMMTMCRAHHIEYGDKVEHKDFLKEVHAKVMAEKGL